MGRGYSEKRYRKDGKCDHWGGGNLQRKNEKAKEYGIYVKEDKSLVELLDKFELYDEIPEELYEIIAEIFFYVYNIEKKV